MEQLLGIVAIALAIISVAVALWQGFIARSQLKSAQETERRTEVVLDEIRRTSGETRLIADDIKSNLLQQVNSILESKLAGEANTQSMSRQLMEGLLGNIGKKTGEGPPAGG
ncbi:MAG TPA: hypothetical protein VNQ52_12240 [Microbacteriaceae bacterium]|nr:hypothetical protein [Microbacteriaceae bacterium]